MCMANQKKEVFTFDHDGAGTGNQTTSVSIFSLFSLCVFLLFILILPI